MRWLSMAVSSVFCQSRALPTSENHTRRPPNSPDFPQLCKRGYKTTYTTASGLTQSTFLSMLTMVLDLNPSMRELNASTIAALVLVAALTAVLIDYFRVLRLRWKMPPGPIPMPIIGNVLQLPKSKPWYRFEEWANKYNSPIITVWFGRNPTVVLNDCWTASDLMDKRANIYSSRPTFQVPGVVMDGEKFNQTMLPYGDRWRLHRKLTVPPDSCPPFPPFRTDVDRSILVSVPRR